MAYGVADRGMGCEAVPMWWMVTVSVHGAELGHPLSASQLFVVEVREDQALMGWGAAGGLPWSPWSTGS